ncbi:MAG: hypothetical protein BGO11_13320 [Solirubrobacterales bacterium 70-9]|nr:MAG: hypothetical protein BGO11_13320 [Solirubrobacterales bacterium 70-9]
MIRKACVVCGKLSDRNRCERHRRPAWGDRPVRENRSKLSGSAQQKRARRVLEAHYWVCHVCREFGSDEVDHVIPLSQGGADDESNLRPIHSEPCHRLKTAEEARQGRART